MICSFDYYDRLEQPTLILCSPDDTEIGVISNPKDFNPTINFNDISNISYTIYKDPSPSADNTVYDKHIERRQVHVSGMGYFIINSVTEQEDDEGCYKKINAQSCESELNNISMPFISGTYQLYKAENFDDNWKPSDIPNRDKEYLNENCLLYEVLKSAPCWTLEGQSDFVDIEEYIKLGETHRTFESVSSSVYAFLKNEMSESYDCYVHFDIENRKIRILKYEDVFEEIPVIISDENFLDSCVVKTTTENYVNCLDVDVTGGVNISSCNPLGDRLIYNFDRDIEMGLIDGELKEALEFWKNNLELSAEYSGYKINSITREVDGEEITFDGADSIQTWIDAPLKLTEYKVSLLEAIGTGIQEEIDKVLNNESFLSSVGLDYTQEGLDKKAAYISDLRIASNLLENTDENKALKDTSTIEQRISNIFMLISFEKDAILNINIPISDGINPYTREPLFVKTTETRTILGQNHALIAAQELSKRFLATDSKNEISLLKAYLNGYEAQLKAIEATVIEGTSTTPEMIEDQKKTIQGYIDRVNADIEFYNDIVETVNAMTASIDRFLNGGLNEHNEIEIGIYERNRFIYRFTEYFNGDEDKANNMYLKLTRYLKQQSYSNENIIITDSLSISEKSAKEQELYDDATNLLTEISVPGYEVTVEAESFMLLPEVREAINMVKLNQDDTLKSGTDYTLNINSAIHIKLPSGEVPLFHILSISINYEEATCSFTFGNRLKMSDPSRIFADLQKTTASNTNIIAQERINWGINEEKVNELMSLKNSDIDTTFRAMSNGINNVTQGSDGWKCFATNEDGSAGYGMWAANGVMMFINENGNAEMAVGRLIDAGGNVKYGVNGHTLLANSVTADKLSVGSFSKGTNYIKNGSFENYIKSDDINKPECWNYDNGDGSYEVTNEIRTPVGTNSLRAKNNIYLYQEDDVEMPAGDYVISYYYHKADNDLNGMRLGCMFSYMENSITKHIDVMVYPYDNAEEITMSNGIKWFRCSKCIKLTNPCEELRVYAQFFKNAECYIDGIMIERSTFVNEYSPHINEMYAKYTNISDDGISVYNGKISVFNNNGESVIQGDTNGDLTITGVITAKAGGSIAGWNIGEDKIVKSTKIENVDKYTGIKSSGNFAFFAGATGYDNGEPTNALFRVKHDGSLFADSANITGVITASELTATNSGKIANWTITKDALTGGMLRLERNGYITEFDGRSLRFGQYNSSGVYEEKDFGSCISMRTSSNNVFNEPVDDNLSIAGRSVITFGLRGDEGVFKEVARMYKFSYTGNENLLNKNVLDINSVKVTNMIIGGTIYKVSASTVSTVGVSGISLSTDKFLKLDSFAGTLGGLLGWS